MRALSVLLLLQKQLVEVASLGTALGGTWLLCLTQLITKVRWKLFIFQHLQKCLLASCLAADVFGRAAARVGSSHISSQNLLNQITKRFWNLLSCFATSAALLRGLGANSLERRWVLLGPLGNWLVNWLSTVLVLFLGLAKGGHRWPLSEHRVLSTLFRRNKGLWLQVKPTLWSDYLSSHVWGRYVLANSCSAFVVGSQLVQQLIQNLNLNLLFWLSSLAVLLYMLR